MLLVAYSVGTGDNMNQSSGDEMTTALTEVRVAWDTQLFFIVFFH